MKKKSIRGFTLAETVIVIIIVGLILSMIVFLGSEYLKELKLRKEKEELINMINYATSYVKSSNYYQGQKFSNMIVTIATGGIDIALDSSSGTGFSSYTLLNSEISFLNSPISNQISLLPYQRECVDATINNATGVDFKLSSTINELSFCFSRDMSLCKLFIVTCP